MSQANPPRVFISYSSNDRTWADKAVEALEEQGIRCWYAPRDICAGDEWGSAIIDGIDQCRAMIVVFSGHANESSHVRREVERAIGKGVVMLPIRIDDCRPTGGLDYALSNTHWLDASQPPMEQRLNELVDAVRRLTSGKDVTEAAPSKEPVVSLSEPRQGGRYAIIVGVLLAVAVPAALTVWSRATDTPSAESAQKSSTVTGLPEVENVDANGDPFADETLEFQGRWKVVSQYNPLHGFYPKQAIEQRRCTWFFRGSTLTTDRRPTRKTRAGSVGSVSLRSTATERHFDFAGRDSEGQRLMIRGIYEADGESFKLCFRMNAPGTDAPPVRPTTLSLSDQSDVVYMEMVRQ